MYTLPATRIFPTGDVFDPEAGGSLGATLKDVSLLIGILDCACGFIESCECRRHDERRSHVALTVLDCLADLIPSVGNMLSTVMDLVTLIGQLILQRRGGGGGLGLNDIAADVLDELHTKLQECDKLF